MKYKITENTKVKVIVRANGPNIQEDLDLFHKNNIGATVFDTIYKNWGNDYQLIYIYYTVAL